MTTPNNSEEIVAEEVQQNGQYDAVEGKAAVNDGGKETTTDLEADNGTTNAGGVAVNESEDQMTTESGAEKGGSVTTEKEEAAANGGTETTAVDADARALGTKTPPASEQRQTPPHSANTRAPTVRKRCSAVFGTPQTRPSSSGGGGLSSLTSALGKKPRKQSVLDSAASGWRAFVQEEQLEQEMQSHMRSKDAYLDKQEFLLRADYSQFERERDLRAQERRVQQQQGNSNTPR